MNNLVRRGLTPEKIETMGLEDLLTELLKYGHPNMHHLDKGWRCNVEMFVSAKGVDFKVASEFGHITAARAAAECLSRVIATLSEVTK